MPGVDPMMPPTASAGPTPSLTLSRRIRRTPFSDRVAAAGVQAYTVYNHMLLPTVFESLEADCRHLKHHVQVWDVACQRQVEIRGPDAARLMQLVTPRDLARMMPGQCRYVPVVDEAGGMLNDPVALRLADDRFWISIADSDLLYWIAGLACGLSLDVAVREPDVSPLAVQGPKAEKLVARVLGDAVRGIPFFRFRLLPFEGRELVVARSGYSKQGGFEIYVEGADLGLPLWDALLEAGRDLGVRAGCPNLIERVESGLLSYGNDMTRENTPFECGLGRLCDLGAAIACVGRDALLRLAAQGPVRQIRWLSINGGAVAPCTEPWPAHAGARPAGRVTSAVWSPDFGTVVAVGMIDVPYWDEGTRVEVATPDGVRPATVRELPFAARAPA
jgi:dimethylsulfoniopropionate demethylase